VKAWLKDGGQAQFSPIPIMDQQRMLVRDEYITFFESDIAFFLPFSLCESFLIFGVKSQVIQKK